jgi:cyanophycin synthetase
MIKIENIKVMRGPNYWSNYRKKLIVMKLDIEELENYPTNKIEGFAERMMSLMPGLIEHRCSEGYRGGFLARVNEGTWIGHVIEHFALELQCMAGMECGFGRTRSTSRNGVYNVVFSYIYEDAGIYAAHAAVRIAEALVKSISYNIESDILKLNEIRESLALGPSTKSIVDEAQKRNIPYRSYDNGALIIFGQGEYQRSIQATIADSTSFMGIELAGDKDSTKQMLARFNIPVPEGIQVSSEEQLQEIFNTLKHPLVVKPIDGNHGRGVTTNIRDYHQLREAFLRARQISDKVVVEKFIEGSDYRFLVINYKLVAVAKRTPPTITGDGRSTIRSLIDALNADPKRGVGHAKVLTYVEVDEVTECILREKNYTLDTVLREGEDLVLKKVANLSTGGTATNVTELVHPYNSFLAERIARIVNLNICGIDIITKTVSLPIVSDTGAVIEVNAAPGFRMHLCPAHGTPVNVARPVLDMLFPPKSPVRIPLVAVTGTNGKTTTTRLIAHMAKQAGHKVGCTTTDGIYIRGHMIEEGDCTGAVSAEKVLTDPTVDFAVLECARGGILRSGLGFDNCDVSIITNVSEDHLGLQEINTLEDMAAVKEVVARSTFQNGYSILNADDELVYHMAENLDCNIALFSMRDELGRVQQHCDQGGLGAVIENGWVIVYKGKLKTRIANAESIPLSFSGRSEAMIKNILAAVLAGIIQHFKLENIRAALNSFLPSPELTPGRMNLFHFHDFDVLIDYAHNTGGFVEQKKFIDNWNATETIGIITAVGDRRDEDIRNVGCLSAQMFDRIIIRLDKDLRGRPSTDLINLLHEGIIQGDADTSVTVIPDEIEALEHALTTAGKGALIVLCSDNIKAAIQYTSQAQRKQEELHHQSLVLV